MAELTLRGKLEKFLNEKNCVSDLFKLVESKTGVNRLYVFAGVVACLFLLLLTGVADHFIVSLIGFIYPAYSSVKAIQTNNRDSSTKWLTYWVVYGGFVVLEVLGDFLFYWFPMYFLFKCGFLVWCMAPMSWNGSLVIYGRFIEPMSTDLVADASKKAGQFMKEAETKVKEAVTEVLESKQD